MTISADAWTAYIKRLSRINKTAAKVMQAWVDAHGFDDITGLIAEAHRISTIYGEAAAAASCEMYDAIALAQKAAVPSAIPAATATYQETASAIQGALSNSETTVVPTVSRLVKQAGADTMIQNAKRDGAEWAWISQGDTCAFCMVLASRGWQDASKAVLKGNHAEHIHANCDCQFLIRFDGKSKLQGYNPAKFLNMYNDADGRSWQAKMNSMRRDLYAENREKINEQKRAAYAARKEKETP